MKVALPKLRFMFVGYRRRERGNAIGHERTALLLLVRDPRGRGEREVAFPLGPPRRHTEIAPRRLLSPSSALVQHKECPF